MKKYVVEFYYYCRYGIFYYNYYEVLLGIIFKDLYCILLVNICI